MKTRITYAIAAALAAGATSLAFAQAVPQPTQATPAELPSAEPTSTPAATPTWTPSKEVAPSNLTFVQEPVASLSTAEGAQGADAEIAKAIADALNAEPTMKNSKITVQPDNGTFTLTGVVPTREQVKKAGEIAKQMAGEAIVINAILDSQT